MSAALDLPAEEFTESEVREIEAQALTDLAESTERRGERALDFEAWQRDTWGTEREAQRIASVYILARLWAQMHKAAETPYWLQQLERTTQEWREMA